MTLKTRDISFCDKNSQNIIENSDKDMILSKMKKHHIDINYKSAIILNSKLLKNITYHQHLLSTKTIGTNYFLFLTKINDVNYCFYIDRKVKQGYNYPRIISIKYRFADELFNDTLFDGEIIRDNNNLWHFLISDLILYKGEKLNCNITSRYKTLYNIFEKFYSSDQYLEICPIKIKKLFKYDQWDTLVNDFIPNLNYNIRGLYFNTLNPKCTNYLYIFPRNQTFKKTIVDNDQKIVFEVMKTENPDIYNIFCMNKNQKFNYGLAHISSIILSKKLRKIFNNSNNLNMICKYSKKFGKWEPIIKTDEKISDYDTITSSEF